MTIACMGGWCLVRERCEHYQATDRRNRVERMCDKGRDGVISSPVVVYRQPPKVHA